MVKLSHNSSLLIAYKRFLVAVFPYLDQYAPGTLKTLQECFAAGYAKSADRPFLGHRPVISTNPLTFAKHYVWQTYRQVNERRCILGSGIHKLFQDGTVGGGELPTVGIWSPNIPGTYSYSAQEAVC
jgi:long-chain acyl-CoA synthetase